MCFDFLKPALEAQLGLAESEDDLETAIISEALNKNGNREDFVRASSTKAQDGIIRGKTVSYPGQLYDAAARSIKLLYCSGTRSACCASWFASKNTPHANTASFFLINST